ncbi:MAG: hypothetical protein WCN92_07655 [Eubacteriales bacterium]
MNRKIKVISETQEGIYGNERKKFIKRLRFAMIKITVLLSWSMEDSIQTADSMHSRGYGTGKMTKLNPYIFGKKDAVLLSLILVLLSLNIVSVINGKVSYRFYPFAQTIQFDAFSVFCYFAYFVMLSLPLLVEIKEAFQWRFYMSKI